MQINIQVMCSRLIDRLRRERAISGVGSDGSAIAPFKSLLFTTVRTPIVLAVTVAVLLRSAVMLGYQRAFWYGDSPAYVSHALEVFPGTIKPLGYSIFLRILLPFHSSVLAAAIQHIMGVGIGILVYVLLRRWQVRPMLATAAALPVFLDPRQLVLEHSLLSEPLFTCCLTGAVAVTLWRRQLTAPAAGVAGLLLAAATLTRSIGMPLVVLYVVLLLAQRVRFRTLLAGMASCVAPLFVYGLWFQAHHGVLALGANDGLVLWGRTMSFADCAKIRPPSDLAPLCPRKHPVYSIWNDPNAWFNATGGPPYSPYNNSLARQFALRAIIAQPVDYAVIVARDLIQALLLSDPPVDADSIFLFSVAPYLEVEPQTAAMAATYGYEDALPVIEPFWTFLGWYQYWIFLPGLGLFAALVAPAVFVLRRKRLPIPALIPWTMAVMIVVLGMAISGAEYRYILPAVPLACMALALTMARTNAPRTVTISCTTPVLGRHAETAS
jgi:hypothetical protein